MTHIRYNHNDAWNPKVCWQHLSTWIKDRDLYVKTQNYRQTMWNWHTFLYACWKCWNSLSIQYEDKHCLEPIFQISREVLSNNLFIFLEWMKEAAGHHFNVSSIINGNIIYSNAVTLGDSQTHLGIFSSNPTILSIANMIGGFFF